MKKILREIDEKRGIVQITVADERWYMKSGKDPKSGIPVYAGVPSVTWIASFYPKGIGFYKWLAEMGWDEAQAAKQAAGDKGSAVHLAIERILNGFEFRIDTKVEDKSARDELNRYARELTYEELVCVKSFCDWREQLAAKGTPVEVLATEIVVFSEKHGYAGTVDLVCRIGEDVWIVDFKTSKNVWTEYELQVSAYRAALQEEANEILADGKPVDFSNARMAILQVGYERNKSLYRFTEVEDSFGLFLTAKTIWQHEAGSQEPKVRDFPIVLAEGKAFDEPEPVAEEAPEPVAEEAPEPVAEEAPEPPSEEEPVPSPVSVEEPVTTTK